MNIKKKIAHLKTKYKTNNPFELAELLGILILYEELGSINGYYNKQLRLKQLHINCNLNRHEQLFTCAHELGHALLHPNENTQFLRNNTLLSLDKLEIEANKFAMELLISDDSLLEYNEYSIEQLSRLFGYNEKLIELRMK
ncbi:MAG: ImmA/IrrE family metallo-endopeptidase [Lachnospiraceae bacterium]|nr:ImmA/IrrE family metallo-endopeptidase [Lachnospiraceae bacterium]